MNADSTWIVCPMCGFACAAIGDQSNRLAFACPNSDCVGHENPPK